MTLMCMLLLGLAAESVDPGNLMFFAMLSWYVAINILLHC